MPTDHGEDNSKVQDTQFYLLRIRRFFPLFVTQFLGALNDNLFKNALVILILYRLAEAAGLDGPILVNVAAGAFILPFFIFSATAGQLADTFKKSRLIGLIKLAEILIMGLAVAGFLSGDPYLMLAVLVLMATQSTFFGPLKYGILPDQLHEDELIGGNALIEAGTFLAILIGTILGGRDRPHRKRPFGGLGRHRGLGGLWVAIELLQPACRTPFAGIQ